MSLQSYDFKLFLGNAKLAAPTPEAASAVQALLDKYCQDIEIPFLDDPQHD